MLRALDPPVKTLDEFVKEVLPAGILSEKDLFGDSLDKYGKVENDMVHSLKKLAGNNMKMKSYIGTGYARPLVPEVIKRNVLENPAWYTSYTPYQAEISQGRLESLLNFQTLTSDLTALPIANASVLDEPTAAAEAMTMSMNSLPAARMKKPNKTFVVSDLCHPQTIAVLNSRAEGFGINIKVGDVVADSDKLLKDPDQNLIGVLVQYPDTEGGVNNFQSLADATHAQGGLFCVATDLLALTLMKAPGEFGADIAFGSAQRFGVPMGYGGPHAAFFACTEKLKRKIPGRLVGVSKDRLGNRALRLALQTREQHIRREKATSNICTAQALLANMSAFYAIYHGPHGLKAIAQRIVTLARVLQQALKSIGFSVVNSSTDSEGWLLFDTLVFDMGKEFSERILNTARSNKLNFRDFGDGRIGITVDEATSRGQLRSIVDCFKRTQVSDQKQWPKGGPMNNEAIEKAVVSLPDDIRRTSTYLTHPVFNTYHSETAILRYMHHLQSKDLSLVHSMIPLGSCTMKLNATSEMVSLSMPGFSSVHPFAPVDQLKGYQDLISQLRISLAEITGMHSVSFQPNSGAQGEFAGLRIIRKYQMEQSSQKRDVCLIPVSAHGTNPASAAMAGMRVVPLKCETTTGNLDMDDLKAKCEKYQDSLAAIMITYPSTFGVFEPKIKEVCDVVHQHGGQVYMDGANLNAQIGLCSPGEIGADVCHLNLHKTFCIPRGGGGPGVGPIAVREHLTPYLPGHPLISCGGDKAIDPVNGAPWGSASILPISYAYIKMMGGKGLTHATKITLLNANYILSRLKPHYPILYTNSKGRCAHEFILDARKFTESAGIEALDIAKRLQDYGFHAPTMSWPVANTLMIEPTESENKEELDRFCDALISIREEIAAIEKGDQPREGNVMKMSPHTQADLMRNEWGRPYSRETAAYPLPWLREKKFWPTVTRVDDGKNHFVTCEIYADIFSLRRYESFLHVWASRRYNWHGLNVPSFPSTFNRS
jgi:glycine dehydrogenase